MRELDPRIDAALDTYPMASLPPGFTSRVMSHIQAPRPAFRLTYLDFALPVFVALFASSILGAALWGILLFDPLLWARLQKIIQVCINQAPALPGELPLIFPAVGMFLLAAALIATAAFSIFSPSPFSRLKPR
jgi:hypothetical protein